MLGCSMGTRRSCRRRRRHISPPTARWLPASEGELSATAVSAWAASHPVTDGVSLRDVLVERALALRVPADAQVLASNADGQALILASASGSRWVEVAFALRDSNLPLQPGFPVFLSNALDWMTEKRRRCNLLQAHTVPVAEADARLARTPSPHALATGCPLVGGGARSSSNRGRPPSESAERGRRGGDGGQRESTGGDPATTAWPTPRWPDPWPGILLAGHCCSY
jgi:hypothetical protein